MSEMMEYYHYTNKAGWKGITQSRYIKESTRMDGGDDARFGQGVYLTTVPPSRGKREIIETCWGPNQFPRFVINGRVDYVIWIRISKDQVNKAINKPKVYIHKGDLYLENYKWGYSRVPDNN